MRCAASWPCDRSQEKSEHAAVARACKDAEDRLLRASSSDLGLAADEASGTAASAADREAARGSATKLQVPQSFS
eukprot:3408690-Pleurochrysis_carterae.AAC.2